VNGVLPEQGIKRELSLTELISKTFDLYRQAFTKYLVLFVVVGAITGGVTAVAQHFFILPALPSNATPQEFFTWAPGFFGVLIPLLASVGIVNFVFFPIAQGGAVKLASHQIEKGEAELGASIRFAASKLIWIWALEIVVGLIVVLGFVALVIPGVILAIMFVLALPILLLEDKGVFDSMGKSRELVGHRWLKTFATFLVLAIIMIVAEAIIGTVTRPFGAASPLVGSILSAFYEPLFPILLAVYYYSNLARIAPAPPSPTAPTPTTTPHAGMKFCPNCGTRLASSVTFCTECGAKQPD
jgi:hypothetical protein